VGKLAVGNKRSIRRVIRLCPTPILSALAVLGLLATLPEALAQAGRTTGLPLPRFVSLGADEVNLRFGPGEGYPIAWILTREGLPVEIVQEFDTWRKVRLHDGDLGWIHASLLSSQRTVIVADEVRALRQTADREARIVLRAEPGVIGQLIDCDASWCRVEIEGRRGWLQRAELWGVLPDETGR
jgi:SH3-like domain-containing protein